VITPGPVGAYERGLTAARESGMEAYLLRCAAPLAVATGSGTVLTEAAGLLEQASIPDGGAWMPGYEAYLSLAQAWLARGEPDLAARHGLPHVLREARETLGQLS
jgi:hypothetical protein